MLLRLVPPCRSHAPAGPLQESSRRMRPASQFSHYLPTTTYVPTYLRKHLPTDVRTLRSAVEKKPLAASQLSLLTLPVIGASLFVCFGGMFAIAFQDPTIAPFLAAPPYNLTETEVGLVYSSSLLTYAFLSVFAGPIANALGDLPALSLGLLLSAAGLIILAPLQTFEFPLSLVPFLAQHTRTGSVAQAIAAMCLLGVGGAFCFIPANALMVAEAKAHGLGVESSSDAIAALSMIAFTAGAVTGPAVSGPLLDTLGFRRSYALVGLILALLVLPLVIIVGGAHRWRRWRARTATRATTPAITADAIPAASMGERLLGHAAPMVQ